MENPRAIRSWVIGKALDADIRLDQSEIDAHHAVLTEYPDGYALADLGSLAGTYVNGRRLEPQQPSWVSEDDQIVVGRTAAPWPSRSRPSAPPAGAIERVVTIGRGPENQIQLDFPAVSWEHARLLTTSSGESILEDLGSTNGTFLNHDEQRLTRAAVTPRDEVRFGTYRVPVSKLLEGDLNLGADAGAETIQFHGERWTVGRDPECDFSVDDPAVSWRHAEFRKVGDRIRVRDLGSRNGTFVQGKRVRGEMDLEPGAEITLGRCRFSVAESGSLRRQEFRGNVTIEAAQVSIEGNRGGQKVTLLDSVSLTIFPSELIALMGTSGAGKTTLMNALIGLTPLPAGRGRVLFNGRDLRYHYDEFRHLLGYVPQDDIVHPDLTVEEALRFTARLRTDLTPPEIEQRITRVLEQLELTGKRKDRIGTPENKILSGGERKRVNIAMELISDPDVLLLDEPISGLSSEDSNKLIALLRKLADGDGDKPGKTIIASIHQPSLELFRTFDNVIVIARDRDAYPGHLAYYGPAYPDSLEFFHPEGVAEAKRAGMPPSPELLLQGAAKRKADQWRAAYEKTETHQRFVEQRAGAIPAPPADGAVRAPNRGFSIGQWLLLSERALLRKTRDKAQLAIQFAQALVFGLLLGLLFNDLANRRFDGLEDWQTFSSKVSTSHFMLVIAALWFGCSSSVRDIVGERAVYVRERMVNLKLVSYVLSKFAVNGLLGLGQVGLLLIVIYPLSKLQADWYTLGGVLLAVLLVGVAMGLLISSLAGSTESAIAMMPLVLLPMIILGGGLQPTWRIENQPIQWLAATMPTRWAFEAAVLEEAGERPTVALENPCSGAVGATAEAYEAEFNKCAAQVARFTRTRASSAPERPQLDPRPAEDVAASVFPASEPAEAPNWSKRHAMSGSLEMLVFDMLLMLTLTGVVLRRRDRR